MEKFKSSGKKEQPKKVRYEYFKDKDERHDIYEFSKELTKYIHENGIKDVILIDRSARPAWVGIDEYWKNNYPEEQRPAIHFINPEPLEFSGFIKSEDLDRDKVIRDIEEVEKTGSSPLFDKFNNRIKSFADEFVEKYKIDRESTVLIFDTCSHTGETIQAVANLLGAAGYDVKILTANDADRIATDGRLDKNTIMTSCYPFGTDPGVKKEDSIISSLDDRADRHGVVTSRKEIRKIIDEKGK